MHIANAVFLLEWLQRQIADFLCVYDRYLFRTFAQHDFHTFLLR